MLKAVRFDEEKHKDLLDFVLNYRDSKNKSNESEAIRFLMKKGLENLNCSSSTKQNNLINHKSKRQIKNVSIKQPLNVESIKKEILNEINNKPIDIDSIKKELMNDVMLQLNNQTMNSLNSIIDKMNNLQLTPQIIQQPAIQQKVVNNEEYVQIEAKKEEKSKISIPVDTNPLLANILSNANR